MGGVIWTCFRANGAEKEHYWQGEHRQRDELSETRPAGSSRPGRSYMMNEKFPWRWVWYILKKAAYITINTLRPTPLLFYYYFTFIPYILYKQTGIR
ncbi:hypothetical protein PoMZ_00958 [Pyricularia oryzae]|uniref:Uncharacterized protein n=1 Tax=Pyricularia oryzae TaxID=318829 RepID=A0A4P7N3I0_PYROR|nr:hypothetical protein PoMZ_00958 [Pyricularia oryzae]